MEVAEFNNAVATNKVFTHIEKGHKYRVKDLLISKHPDTGKWYDAVLYIRLEDSELFVRSKESFINNFKLVNYEQENI